MAFGLSPVTTGTLERLYYDQEVARVPGHIVMTDLMICLDTAEENDGYKYIYVQVDIYSWYL